MIARAGKISGELQFTKSGKRVDEGCQKMTAEQWSDWQITFRDIAFIKDSKGAPVRLGNGATHNVYYATVRGVEAAVKQFHNYSPAAREEELNVLQGCRDPHIVNALGACKMDGHVMLALELMEDDLHNKLSDQRGAEEVSWYRRGRRIAIDVARGLNFLHSHQIIHSNLKSPKILLTENGTAKINNLLFRNPEAWTFAWAAPEILMGTKCTEKVDIYSYGVILWELVTGEQPRRGQLRECRVPEECPVEVQSLINSCLSFQPEARPNCQEILKLLTML